MALPPSIHKQFLLSLCFSLPLILLLVYLENTAFYSNTKTAILLEDTTPSSDDSSLLSSDIDHKKPTPQIIEKEGGRLAPDQHQEEVEEGPSDEPSVVTSEEDETDGEKTEDPNEIEDEPIFTSQPGESEPSNDSTLPTGNVEREENGNNYLVGEEERDPTDEEASANLQNEDDPYMPYNNEEMKDDPSLAKNPSISSTTGKEDDLHIQPEENGESSTQPGKADVLATTNSDNEDSSASSPEDEDGIQHDPPHIPNENLEETSLVDDSDIFSSTNPDDEWSTAAQAGESDDPPPRNNPSSVLYSTNEESGTNKEEEPPSEIDNPSTDDTSTEKLPPSSTLVDETATEKKEGPTSSLFVKDTQKEECSSLSQAMLDMLDALARGSFSYARQLALQSQNENPECESRLAALYKQNADAFLSSTNEAIATILEVETRESVQPKAAQLDDPENCLNPLADGLEWEDASQIVLERWDLCCSQLASSASKKRPRYSQNNNIREQCFQGEQRLCCGFYEGSMSYLRLPVLQEVGLHLRLDMEGIDDGMTLQQDGFLRKFDTAGVLWPTGYLLGICLADPDLCGIPEVLEAAVAHQGDQFIAIELGAGVGVPSLVLTRLLQLHEIIHDEPRVLATDRALHALALTATNGQTVGAPVMTKQLEDHTSLTELRGKLVGVGGGSSQQSFEGTFSIVLGSSLQSLFDWKTRDPRHKLWKVLDALLDRTNPHAIAILAHVTGAVIPPKEEEEEEEASATFELIRSISGNDMDMRTRGGDNSDFEISVYKRRRSMVHPDTRQQDESGMKNDEL